MSHNSTNGPTDDVTVPGRQEGDSDSRQRCIGRTRKGKPCRARPEAGSDYCPSHDESDSVPVDEEDKPERPSAATLLVELARERYAFGISDERDIYGVPREGPKVVFLIRGGQSSLRAQLARAFFTRYRKVAAQQALADALAVIEGHAQEEMPQRLYQRVAAHDGTWWLDLGDQTGRAVSITADGWSVQDTAPVLFRRTNLTTPLPEPTRGGDIAELWGWLNFAEDDRPLALAFLVAGLDSEIPHPVFGLFGEQGTAKTTAAKVLTLLLDPSPAPTRKPPKDMESWITAAAGSWFVTIDNLSDIQPWLSDSLCRAVTCEGDIRRTLYTNGDLTVFKFRRCIILTGIDLGALAGDLADRLVSADLAIIADDARRSERELWPGWERAHPRLLGALLDLAVKVKAALPTVELLRKPRMADFAEVLAAVDVVLGTTGLARYMSRQKGMAADALAADPFISAVSEAIEGMLGEEFIGTAKELLDRATPAGDEKWRPPKGWPATPRAATTRLRRQAPVLRKAGWVVTDDEGANKEGIARWTLIPPRRPEMAGKPNPPNPPDPPGRSDQGKGRSPQAGQGAARASGGGLSIPATRQAPLVPITSNPPRGRGSTSGNTLAAGQAGQAGQENPPSLGACGACGGPIDPAAGPVHPGCEVLP